MNKTQIQSIAFCGSADTPANWVRSVSMTTYNIGLSEFGKVESYGRQEDLVECL